MNRDCHGRELIVVSNMTSFKRFESKPVVKIIASTESSTATWACALNTQSSL